MVQNSYVIIFVKNYYDTAYQPLKGTETDDYAIGHTDSVVSTSERQLDDCLILYV